MFSATNKFMTRDLILVFRLDKEQRADRGRACSILDKALKDVFGNAHFRYDFFRIAVPATCDFIEIDAAVSRELAKYPVLKGMRFRLQLHDEMVVV